MSTLTYADIVARLYDMKQLAQPPQDGECSAMDSSRDRSSRYDEETGTYIDWHANRDWEGIDEDGTMCRIEGPGVVWRIWSAEAKDGPLEFYVDGAEEPTFSVPARKLFDSEAGPFPYPELTHVVAKGSNCFVPIPFQKSLRIRGGKDWGNFYHITHTQFPKDTVIPSFTGSLGEDEKAALQQANDIWAKRGPQLFVSPEAAEETIEFELAPGEEKVVTTYDSPAAITSLVMNRPLMVRAESLSILREMSIAITWDDDEQPAVWSPLGDFFGTAAGENLFRTLATGMTKQGTYYSNWYMPFKKARIVIRNDGDQPRPMLKLAIHTEPLTEDADTLLRYHCKWHRDDFSGFDKKQLLDDRWPDWPVLKVDGAAGRFCGFQAHMWNPRSNWAKWQHPFEPYFPKGAAFQPGGRLHECYTTGVMKDWWWGEGDEKFFVDGEKFPSTFGTGTEDYFGYAWGTATAFDSALQAQPRNGDADEIGKEARNDGPGNIGHISAIRLQIPDNVPFQSSFEATVEKYHPNEWPLLNAYTARWYQTPGSTDYYGVVAPEERDGYYVD